MKKLILVFVFIVLFFAKPQGIYAEVIRSFSTEITVSQNGSMNFAETINYDFEYENRHGIFRYIQLYAKVGDLYRNYKIKDLKVLRDGQAEKFSINQTKESIYLKIGDPDKTITGLHEYKIYYTVENGIGSNFETHDEIYWNITGNDWDVPIEKVNAVINSNFDTKIKELICFEGVYGSKDQTCKIDNNKLISSRIYNPGEGLTVVAVFPVDTFPKSILSNNPPQTIGDKIFSLIISNYYLIFIGLNILLPIFLIYWYNKNKNKKRFGAPSVNFDIPKDNNFLLKPAIAGTIDSAKLERDDVVATIFDLAIRKYLKIEDAKKVRTLLPDSNTQKIIKLKEEDSGLDNFEKKLFNRLFRDGDSVDIKDLKIDFYKTFEQMEESVFSDLVKKGYYIKNPKNQKAILWFLAVLAMVFGHFILAFVIFFLSVKLNGRTALGDEMDFKIDGLKLFLKSMDRNYKWQAKNFYTVEQMIPYAMALGYIDKFMEALKILKPDYNPSWYTGTRGSIFTNYAMFSVAAANSVTTHAPSSSSGSSGGFSGGGGGGGGGGSW